MSRKPRIAAHLIIGDREEPFLPALFESISGAVDTLIVNDNGPDPGMHSGALANSAFAKENRLVVDRTPFVDFAQARNVCLERHGELGAGDWIAFIDADEVHGDAFKRIADNLHRVPADVDFIDGYTWHFFQSFDWYTSIERRLMFFRHTGDVSWERPVHEQIRGLSGKRLALPYVYAHYGHVLPARRHAMKGRQYSKLGSPGKIVAEDRLDSIDVETYFSKFWRILLRFRGEHPRAARSAITHLRSELATQLAQTERLVREQQTPADRIRNCFHWLNYEQRWRVRAFSPAAWRLLSPP